MLPSVCPRGFFATQEYLPAIMLFLKNNLRCDKDVGVLAESLHLVIDQWIQYKLGKVLRQDMTLLKLWST